MPHRPIYLLIILNVAVCALLWIGQAIWHKSPQELLQGFFLSYDVQELWQRPYTLLSYGFVHTELPHLWLNMLLLYWLGELCVRLCGVGLFLRIYLLGIVLGGLSFVLSFALLWELIGQNTALIGASGGVMAVCLFLCGYVPNYSVGWGRGFPLWVLGFVLLCADVMSLPLSNTAGHIAHLGGGTAGLLFGFYCRKKGIATPYLRQQKRMNSLLAKVMTSGYESLSQEEKQALFRLSQQK